MAKRRRYVPIRVLLPRGPLSTPQEVRVFDLAAGKEITHSVPDYYIDAFRVARVGDRLKASLYLRPLRAVGARRRLPGGRLPRPHHGRAHVARARVLLTFRAIEVSNA